MFAVGQLLCCGWREIHGSMNYRGDFNDAIRSLRYADAVTVFGKAKCGGFIFTGVGGMHNRPTTKLASDISRHNLGEVILLPVFTNPNTGHKIKTYVWLVDVTALQKYFEDNNLL